MAEQKDIMQAQRGTVGAIDRFASAPPGHSLTQDNSRWAWGRPPQDVDPDKVVGKLLDQLERPRQRGELIKLLVVGVSVESIVEGMIIQGFQEGRFTPDVGLIIKAPLAFYIAEMAEDEGIPYRLFENSDEMERGEMDDRTFFSMMRSNNPRMFTYVKESMNKAIREGMAPQAPAEQNFLNREDSE